MNPWASSLANILHMISLKFITQIVFQNDIIISYSHSMETHCLYSKYWLPVFAYFLELYTLSEIIRSAFRQDRKYRYCSLNWRPHRKTGHVYQGLDQIVSMTHLSSIFHIKSMAVYMLLWTHIHSFHTYIHITPTYFIHFINILSWSQTPKDIPESSHGRVFHEKFSSVLFGEWCLNWSLLTDLLFNRLFVLNPA